jgi:hypothetical protein
MDCNYLLMKILYKAKGGVALFGPHLAPPILIRK